MKQLLGFALLVCTLAAHASDRNIWDLQYLPEAGTLYGESTFTSLAGRAKGQFGHTDINGSQFNQNIGYSFSDRLSLEAAISYVNAKTKPSGSVTKSKLLGWSDPNVMAKYRLIDEDLLLDLHAGAAIESGDAWDNDDNYNVKGENDLDFQGGPSYFAGAEIGQKRNGTQYSLLAQFRRLGESKEHSGANTWENEAHNQYMFQGKLLNTLQEKLFLRTHASVRFIDAYDFEDTNSSGSQKTAPITEYRLGTGFQYALVDDVLGSLGVTYRKLNLESGLIDDYHIWMFTLGARYQF